MAIYTTTGAVLTAAAIAFGIAVTRPVDSALAMFSPIVQAAGQQAPQQKAAPPGTVQDMTKMHQQMMADMKAEQTRLDALVQKMNAASGDAKTGAMAELLTELVRNHKAMADHMNTMHDHMMNMGMGMRGGGMGR